MPRSARLVALVRGRVAWLLAAVTAIAGSVVVLGVMAEDVISRNGQEAADAGRLNWFVDHRSDALVAAARDITKLGAAPIVGVLAVLAAAALWWRGERLIVAIAPGFAFATTAVAVTVTKVLVARARPDVAIRLVPDTEPSFPSGHAADSAALFVALAIVVAAVVFRRPAARVAVVAAAVAASGLIGLSRIVLAAHWPTDVVAGWALGTAVAVVTATVVLVIAPMAPTSPNPARARARLAKLLWSARGPVGPALAA